jgi:two-component system, LuxR family, sensor kinase FixL
MTEKPTKTLRERAEALLRASRSDIAGMATEDVQALVHELQVHQVELDIQNEELRQAQVELSESRDRFSDLYEFAPVGYVTLDNAGRILEANLTATTLLGIERQGLVRRRLSDFVARDGQDDWYLHRQAVVSSENQQTCELLMHKADGTALVVRLESIGFGDPPHRRCRTALIDNTAWNRAEEELRRLNETLEYRVAEQTREVHLLAKAVAHLAEGVVITDDELNWPGPRIRFVNDAMCRITGYAADELIGKTPRMLQGQQSDCATLDRLKRELSDGRSFLGELVNYRKDGRPYDAELFITPLFDAVGRRTNFVSIHRDISEHKELQRQILEIATEEQRRIGQDLHDGTQQELTGLTLVAGTLLDLLNAAPKERIMDQSVWLLDKPGYTRLCETVMKLCHRLSEANRHVQQLAHGIMPVQIDAEGLRSALEELAVSTNGLNEITCRFDSSGPVTVANNTTATHLYRIAQEAVNNALRHGQADEIQISLEQQDGQILLEVRDNGVGIEATNTNRVAPASGTQGMGLRIMQYRTGMIGGTLRVERGETRGTMVRCMVLEGRETPNVKR